MGGHKTIFWRHKINHAKNTSFYQHKCFVSVTGASCNHKTGLKVVSKERKKEWMNECIYCGKHYMWNEMNSFPNLNFAALQIACFCHVFVSYVLLWYLNLGIFSIIRRTWIFLSEFCLWFYFLWIITEGATQDKQTFYWYIFPSLYTLSTGMCTQYNYSYLQWFWSIIWPPIMLVLKC